jgi:hypothetical protein
MRTTASSKINFSLAGASLSLVWVTSSFAQQPRHNERPADCDHYDQVQIPPADLPNLQDRAALANCDAYDLYFAFHRPADPVAARQCAYL